MNGRRNTYTNWWQKAVEPTKTKSEIEKITYAIELNKRENEGKMRVTAFESLPHRVC